MTVRDMVTDYLQSTHWHGQFFWAHNLVVDHQHSDHALGLGNLKPQWQPGPGLPLSVNFNIQTCETWRFEVDDAWAMLRQERCQRLEAAEVKLVGVTEGVTSTERSPHAPALWQAFYNRDRSSSASFSLQCTTICYSLAVFFVNVDQCML